ncbi:helix-turn-helix domain-containing protein [Cupriavidus basilensis]
MEKPIWTAEEVAARLEVSISSAYRYLSNLMEIGLVASAGTGRYVLGPRSSSWTDRSN